MDVADPMSRTASPSHADSLEAGSDDEDSWAPAAPAASKQVTFTLTPDMRRQLGMQYPELQTRFLKLVPHMISEQVFWARYFRSKAR
eukprot:4303319-Prymnesium_polylepis.1